MRPIYMFIARLNIEHVAIDRSVICMVRKNKITHQSASFSHTEIHACLGRLHIQ